MGTIPSRRIVLCALAAILTAGTGAAERPRVYCIQGATVVPAPGRLIEGGGIVLRDGLIEAVGADVAVPPDAVLIDGDGLWVYPGLIDVVATLGQSPEDRSSPPTAAAPRTGPGQVEISPGPVHPLPLVHPERRAGDTLLPFAGDRARQAERMRELGFTTVLAWPGVGVFQGSSAAVLLVDDAPVSEIILHDTVAQHLSFERGRFGSGYPSSLMGTVATIRQVLRDAQRHTEWTRRYNDTPQGMARPDHVPAFVALQDLISGEQVAIFKAESADDILLAHRIADEFRLSAAITGPNHMWEVAEQIRASGRTVILPVAFPDKPEVDDDDEALEASIQTMQRYLEAPAAAARLHDAGVHFALTTDGLKTLAHFKKNLGRMLEEGLPAETALAALTTVPASLMGIERVAGSLEPGKIANVAVFDGPIFAKDTKIQHVFVDGVEHRIEDVDKPEGGDPGAVVDPRGEWSVVFETPRGASERRWEIVGQPGSFGGTAETPRGTIAFDDVRLEGNMLTVVLPGPGGRGSLELTVVITGDAFEGSAQLGPRTVKLTGTRISGPEGGAP